MKMEALPGSCPAVDDELNQILNSLPPKPPRSRLEPHAALIEELRRRGWTYRQITGVLAEKCLLHTSPSTVHYFVTRRKLKGTASKATDVGERNLKPVATKDSHLSGKANVARPIAALKLRDQLQEPSRAGFEFDPSEPLHLPNPGKAATNRGK